MADWYVSSANYNALPAFQTNTAYTVGQIIRPTAPAIWAQHPQRCTTAGTSAASEPSWSAGNNVTTTSGGAVFTNVGGQSAYGWGAAVGNLFSLSYTNVGRSAIGDRIFVASDHAEALATSANYFFVVSNSFGQVSVISVNRAGSVPPVAADIQSGAKVEITGANTWIIDPICNLFWQGIRFFISCTNAFYFSSGGSKAHYFKDCAFVVNHATANFRLQINNPGNLVFDNTTMQFGATSQSIGGTSYPFNISWINTAAPLQGGIMPASLFNSSSFNNFLIVFRGVDLSSLTGNLLTILAGAGCRILLDSCRIAPGLVRLPAASAGNGISEEVELVNCYDGTNILNERNTQAGVVSIDRNVTLSGGAQDDSGGYSLKMVTSNRADQQVYMLDCFWLDVGNALVGTSKTATVEIISSGTLNSNDISLVLEYMGTAGNPVASLAFSLPTVLTAAAALPASTVTWLNPPSTPVKQSLKVTFTPQRAGRVRGLVRLGKPSATVWIDPRIVIT